MNLERSYPSTGSGRAPYKLIYCENFIMQALKKICFLFFIVCNTCLHAQETEQPQFYDTYLARYYPKIMAMRTFKFSHMSPEQIAQALQDFTNLLADEPWFYFGDDQEQFLIMRYWEHIADQCSLMSEFLQKTRVDKLTGQLYVLDDPMMSWTMRKKIFSNSYSLLDYLKQRKITVAYDFYALCFDYLIKLFNEGIVLQDTALASGYLYQMEFCLWQLSGSMYHADYHEAHKTAQELLNLLYSVMGIDQDAWIDHMAGDGMGGCDASTMRAIVEESRALGLS